LDNNRFDAVLLDLGLNEISGLDALRTIRKKAPKIPIIVITGLQEEHLGLSALEDGAQDYLVKGKMDGSVIIRAINHAIEHKLVEESLVLKDRAIESSIECIGFADMFGNIVYANASLLQGLGYDSASEISGKYLFDIIAGKEKSALILKSLREKGSWAGEDRAFRRDGSAIDIQVSASMVKNDSGEPLCIMTSWVDISERKVYESRLKESKEESDKAKSRAQTYFDFMAHDIANIVSPILIYSEMLSDAKDIPPKMRELCVEIESQARRASSLISNLRRLEEVESMSPEEIEDVDLRQVLSFAESTICREFEDKTFGISHSFPEEEKIMVKGSGIVEEVVQKIFDNAARYSDKDAVDIEVRVTETQDGSGKGYWDLEIADNGPGITDQRKGLLTATPDESHRLIRGIYLSISFCISLVGCIRGEFQIRDRIPNEPEKGTKIVIRLPKGD